MLNTKKQSTNLRTSRDFPELAAIEKKLAGLREQQNENTKKQQQQYGSRKIENTAREGRVANAVNTLLGRKKEETVHDEIAKTIEEGEALARAIEQTGRERDQIRREIANTLYNEDYGKIHKEYRRDILEAAIMLAEKIAAEKNYAIGPLRDAGALIDTTPGHRLWLNTSQCPGLLKTFQYLLTPQGIANFKRDNANLFA